MWDMYGLNAELGFLDTWWSQENKINSKRFSTLFLFSSSDSADLIESLVHYFAIICNSQQCFLVNIQWVFMVNQDVRVVD